MWGHLCLCLAWVCARGGGLGGWVSLAWDRLHLLHFLICISELLRSLVFVMTFLFQNTPLLVLEDNPHIFDG
jgi:hypothetical protein